MIQIKRNNLQALVKQHVTQLKPEIFKILNDTIYPAWNSPLINYLKNNLDQILSADPAVLKNIVIPNISYSNIPLEKQDELDLIGKAFDYQKFIRYRKTIYNGYTLAEKLNCSVCPYCNRQYTFIEKGKTRPEFDHFYAHSEYPYLALSFYNLVPSCHICNSNMKGSVKFDIDTHIHPYIEGYEEELRFSVQLKPGKASSYFYGNEDSFDLIFKANGISNDKLKRANNNISAFRLLTIYNKHKDYVMEILQKYQVYDDDYLNSLYTQYQGTLFRSLGDVHRMILSNYLIEEDLDKRVLAKLTRDLADELGII